MPLAHRLTEIVLHSLANFEMVEGQVWHNYHWRQPEVNFLNFCLSQGYVSAGDLHHSVQARILEIGADMFTQTSRREGWVYADHVTSPPALAFAIQEKQLTDQQLAQIRFDHDDTAETFMHSRIVTLVADVMKQLTQDVPLEKLILRNRVVALNLSD